MNPVIDDEQAFIKSLRAIVELNRGAGELAANGTRVISCDEKTGMQALERLATTPMTANHPERPESWYKRHGTLCLTANLDLASGQVIAPTLAETRGNDDFVRHIEKTVGTDPKASWIFVVDNLNTHCSAELVGWVSSRCRLDDDLGKKGRHGILKSRATRSDFLSDPTHSIRFVYTPKHCSWINEVERWFSKLARSVLRRGSFKSKEDLRNRVLAYIHYYNIVDAKPHKWKATAASILAKMRITTSEGLN
jgi:hypothetical protein